MAKVIITVDLSIYDNPIALKELIMQQITLESKIRKITGHAPSITIETESEYCSREYNVLME